MNTAADKRHIPLDGTPNFRDLGGYETEDGRKVKWRRVFRSGTLADLTDKDHEKIETLEIQRIYDLRTDDERATYPSRLPENGPSVIPLSIHGRDVVRGEGFDLEAYLRSLTAEEFVKGIKESYHAFVITHAHQYNALFDHLDGQSEGAALIHCAAGKDRTGVACALVLHALGVPQETILHDYKLTNRFLDDDYRTNRRAQLIPDGVDFDVELEDALFEARHEYIQAAFDAIDAEYGSLDDYLTGPLNVSDRMRQSLRERLLD